MNKWICSTAVAFAIGSQAYAQVEELPLCPPPFEQGTALSLDNFPAAYNAPARIEVRACWDTFLTASFLFWHSSQDGMDLAYPTTIIGETLQAPQNHAFLSQDENYQPGFKCGLGFQFMNDKWTGLIEYTYFRAKTSNNITEPPNDPRGGTSVWYTTNWFNSPTVTAISTKWKLKLDILDGLLSRSCYQGQKLIIQPFGGLRTGWIRQCFIINAIDYYSSDNVVSHNRLNSWVVGPRAGCKSSWLLRKGFRLEGDIAGNLLYTRFNSIKHYEGTTSIKFHHLFLVRPAADMELGLGWGRYFDRQTYHFDLLATYSFNVMWGQNQMRALVDEYQSHVGAEVGDLQIHGLNASIRLDF